MAFRLPDHRSSIVDGHALERFRGKFGDLSGIGIAARIGELAEDFLTDQMADKKIPAKATD